jgi:hypothetical protein
VKNSKIIKAVSIAIAAGLMLASCGGNNADTTTSEAARESANLNGQAFAYYQDAQPVSMPAFSQYRKTLDEAQMALAEGVSTWTYATNNGIAKPFFACPSIGPVVPENASQTPPEEAIFVDSPGDGNSRPDALVTGAPTIEPTLGIFQGEGTNGSYVMCLGQLPDGRSYDYLARLEAQANQFTVPMLWDEEQQMMVVDEAALIEMLDNGVEIPEFTNCAATPEKCTKEGVEFDDFKSVESSDTEDEG